LEILEDVLKEGNGKTIDVLFLEILEDVLKEENEKTIDGKVK
jgi:hypothetical protein